MEQPTTNNGGSELLNITLGEVKRQFSATLQSCWQNYYSLLLVSTEDTPTLNESRKALVAATKNLIELNMIINLTKIPKVTPEELPPGIGEPVGAGQQPGTNVI